MRTVLTCLAALLLAGCYESGGMLLDAGKARQPIKTGQDWKYGSGDDIYHARLTPRADGWYDFAQAEVDDDGSDGSWEHRTALLNFLRKDGNDEIYIVGSWDEGEDAYIYGLVIVQPNGGWQSVIPNCDRFSARDAWHEADLAAAWKASAGQTHGGFACYFSSPLSLRLAMNNVVNTAGFRQRVAAAGK